ncbi:hypothetical protein EF405_00315 [Cyclobacteriaceae bacterium YHN15]|nr:hypothetical protein EF405_00315 [Cyclobacteriaceae bacterium YHN15]
MKNSLMLLSLCLMLSCSEPKKTGEGSGIADQLEEVESIAEIDSKSEPDSSAESFGLIGRWTIPSSYGGGELKIEHHLGKYYKNEELNDGTVNISEVVLKEEGGLRIFSLKDQSSSEVWVIIESGELEVRGKDGLIYSSKAN